MQFMNKSFRLIPWTSSVDSFHKNSKKKRGKKKKLDIFNESVERMQNHHKHRSNSKIVYKPIYEQIIQTNSVNQIDWFTEKKIGPIHEQNI